MSEQEIGELLQTLDEDGIMVKAHQTEGKTFYKVADEHWGNFILDCFILLQDVVRRMELYWACVRNSHTYHGQAEVRWYYTVVGEEQGKRFFLNDKEKTKSNKLRQIYEFLEYLFKDREMANKDSLFKKIAQEIVKDEIKGLDKLILYKIREIDEEDWTIANSEGYENVRDKHKVIFSIMRKIIYPPFLNKLLHQDQT